MQNPRILDTSAKAAAKDQARTARKAQEVAKQAEAASPAQQDGVRNGTSLTDHREIEIKLGVLGRPDSLPEVFASLGKVSGERSDLLENLALFLGILVIGHDGVEVDIADVGGDSEAFALLLALYFLLGGVGALFRGLAGAGDGSGTARQQQSNGYY